MNIQETTFETNKIDDSISIILLQIPYNTIPYNYSASSYIVKQNYNYLQHNTDRTNKARTVFIL